MTLGMTALLLSQLTNVPDARPEARRHLTVQSTIRDILGHPSFAEFSRLILPWDDRAYDENPRLSGIGSLLPYHTHVDPMTATNA